MSKAKRTTKTAKPSADATATTPPDKPDMFEARRESLFAEITQQLAVRGLDAKIEREKDCIAEYYQLTMSCNDYNVSLRFRCREFFTVSTYSVRKRTGWPEVAIDCVSPSVTYKPKGGWSNGAYVITQGVNVVKIVERFELAFEQHRAKDERERDRTSFLEALLTEARLINAEIGCEIVDVDRTVQQLIIRPNNYSGPKLQALAKSLASSDTLAVICPDTADSLDQLDREIQNTRRRLAERFAK